MSDEEQTTETQVLTAEFKDGHLEIVEVTPFDNNETRDPSALTEMYSDQHGDEHILPDMAEEEETQYKVLDSAKGLLQLDLLNLTLVKCSDGDGEESYRLVSNQEADGELGETVTCVLQSSDGEEENQDAYMSKKEIYLSETGGEQYVVVNQEQSFGKKKLTALELLERAKAAQKVKASLPDRRKRRSGLPPPRELLAAPGFKLFIYSCKLCSFKCNAIKELTAHKASAHSEGAGRARARAGAATLQCARCPFRGASHSQLMKHVQEKHLSDSSNAEVCLQSAAAEAADVLVCGACGYESAARAAFRAHVATHHA